MFHLDLKRAAVAIAASRLDDAFTVLTTSSDRTHRDAQTLIDQLTNCYIERAQRHLEADRLTEARHDADRALRLAGNRLDVADLMNQIQKKANHQQTRQHEQQRLLSEVKQQADAGHFSLGHRLLNEMHDSQASQPAQQATLEAKNLLKQRRQVVDHSVKQISELQRKERPEVVAAEIQKLNAVDQNHPQMTALKNKTIQTLCVQANKDIAAGRIDRATSAAESMRGWQHALIDELTLVLSYCSKTNASIDRNDWLAAETNLGLLNQLVTAKWISTALKQVQTISQHLKDFQTGPLGLMPQLEQTVIEQPTPFGGREPVRRAGVNREPVRQKNHSPIGRLPMNIAEIQSGKIVHVDGIGSLLLLSNDAVSIGSASQCEPVDVEVLAEGLDHPIVIRRTSEDYFVESAQSFQVNGKSTQRHLLQDGDSIQIGQRGRLKFSKPVTASSSAVLTLSGTALKRRDIRHIVLLSDSILFGATGCHFKLPEITTPILLHPAGSDIAVRELGADSHTLRPENPLAIGPIRFSLSQIF